MLRPSSSIHEDNSGTIDKKEFYTLLRLNVTDYEDRNRLKTYVNEIFQHYDKNGKGELTKDQMLEACSTNPKIKNLIEKNNSNLINQIIYPNKT